MCYSVIIGSKKGENMKVTYDEFTKPIDPITKKVLLQLEKALNALFGDAWKEMDADEIYNKINYKKSEKVKYFIALLLQKYN